MTSKRTITTPLPDGTTVSMKSGAKNVYRYAVVAQRSLAWEQAELADWLALTADGYGSWTAEEIAEATARHEDEVAKAEAGRWFALSHHGTAAAAAKGLDKAQFAAYANARIVETIVEEG